MNKGPLWHGIIYLVLDGLHLGTGSSHGLGPDGLMNINEHGVNYIHLHDVNEVSIPNIYRLIPHSLGSNFNHKW